MDTGRITAAAIVTATGVGLVAVAARQLWLGVSGVAGSLVAGATLVLGVAFAAGGPAMYRTDVDSDHLLRVAGWNTLGVVVTIAVLGLVAAFQAASGGRVTAPLLTAGVVVGVSAFAHVLIGFNDVRRIRARTVARQRRKAAVVNRFVRHDLKHYAQLLLGYGRQVTETAAAREDADDAAVADGGTSTDLAAVGDAVMEVGSELAETNERIGVIDDLLDDGDERRTVDVTDLLEDGRQRWESDYPDASLTVEVDDDLRVAAGDHLDTALAELIENALEHAGESPRVTVRGERRGDVVRIAVRDDGDGLPELERELINEDRTETQLDHSDGLGLWLTKWIVEHYGGRLAVESEATGGGQVTMSLPAAEATD
ncbi:ATP-binding protein [Halobaculum sp. CBA1158]|uniref:sensor histidine kinase n=1 Tax=Halobaculum sp. CBA1158 TaxID=2904243 RepID=UPI001F36C674|nr:ATP-binding protein [Halobaculum sp. CBA1158]UIO99195.1 ATP-binding protein [Halobaculum sp. CBA1158]